VPVLAQLRPRSVYDVLASVGFFIAVATGGAYAADTIGSADVINDSLKSEDIKNETLRGGDLALNTIATSRLTDNSLLSVDVQDGTLTAADVQDETLTTAEIKNGTIGSADVAANSLGGGRIADNSLKGVDIQESSLDLSGIVAVGSSDSGTPDANPGESYGHHTITAPVAGDLFVMGTLDGARVVCSDAGSCSLEYGLYVDGQPVPGTLRTIQAGASESSPASAVFMGGVATGVSAGEHTVTIGLKNRDSVAYTLSYFLETNSIFFRG
jgi:hypothetical protein